MASISSRKTFLRSALADALSGFLLGGTAQAAPNSEFDQALELGADALDVLGQEFLAEDLSDVLGPQRTGLLIEHGEDAGVVGILDNLAQQG